MSQCSRVLDVLKDHKPHSIDEIHELAGTMRLNSRISDLRRFGFNIAYFRKDGLHTYQLLDGPDWNGAVRSETGIGATADSGCPSLTEPPQVPVVRPLEAGHLPADGPVVGSPPEQPAYQPTIWEAA